MSTTIRRYQPLLALLFTVLALAMPSMTWAANVSLKTSDQIGTTSWTGSTNWDNNAAPSSGNNYFTKNFSIRTPADATAFSAFAGASLSMDPGGQMNCKHNGNFTNNNLLFNGGTLWLGGSANGGYITNYGTIQLNPATNCWVATDVNNRSVDFKSTITGTGGATLIVSNILGNIVSNRPGVLFSGANTFLNAVLITSNTLVKLNNATGLGAVNGATTVTNGSTLDLNGLSPGSEPFVLAGVGTNGAGVVINSGAALVNNGLKGPVTLTADATIGGANRWDIYTPATLNGNGRKLTKVGANEIALANLGNSALGDIQVNGGTLTILGTTTMGDPAKTATVTAGALNFWAVNNTLAAPLVKTVVIQSGASFNNNSGTLFFSGPITLNGTANFSGNGTEMTHLGPLGGTGSLVKGGTHKLVLLGTNAYSGNTTINFNSGTLALGVNGSISNSPLITVNGASTFDVAAVGGGWILMPGKTLIDNGTVLGSVTIAPSALAYGDGLISGHVTVSSSGTLTPGQLGAPGTLSLLQNLTCEAGSSLGFDLANVTVIDGGINDHFAVGGNLTLNGTVAVNFGLLNGAPALGVPYTLIRYAGTLTGSAANLVANSPYPATFDTSVPGEVRVTFAAGSPATLTWTGDASANLWDAGLSMNWFDGANKSLFFQGHNVVFDDTGTSNLTANLVGGIVPNSVTVNSSGNYAFAGSGLLAGSGGLTKQGSGLLTVNNPNTFTGATLIESGTLKLGRAEAVGSPLGATIITNDGTLDVNSQRVGLLAAEPVVVSGAGVGGAGAIVNNGAGGQNSALRVVTLAGDTTVGGAQRFDIRNDGGLASLSSGGQPFKFTKTGPNEHIWVGVEVDPALGDIEVLAGRFGPETTTSGSLGDPTKNIYVGSGATFRFWGWNNSLTKNMVLTNGAILWVNNGTGRILSQVTLDSGMIIADPDGNTLALSNTVSGAGGFNKIDTGNLILAGNNTFTGGISNGAGTVTGTTLSVPGAVAVYGTLAIDQPFDGTLVGPITGAGAFNKAGLSTVTINDAGGYLGTANVNAGRLALAADNVFGSTNINFNGGGLTSADANARTITNFFTVSANYPTPTVLGTPGSGDLIFRGPLANNGGQMKYLAISNNQVTIYNNLYGVGTITKGGPGQLTLAGTNLFVGLTNLQGVVKVAASGVLSNHLNNLVLLPGAQLDVTAKSGYTNKSGGLLMAGRTSDFGPDILGNVVSTGTVTVAGAAVPGTLAISGGLNLAGGMLNFDLAGATTPGAGVNDLIAIGGPLNLSGTTTIQLNPYAGPLAAGTYTLISGGTALASGSTANLTVAGTNGARQTFTVDVTSSPGSVLLVVGGNAASLVWSGAASANWDVNAAVAWMNGGLPDKFVNYDQVLFDGTTANSLVNLTATVFPASFTADAPATFNHIISGAGKISGSVGITKNGLGTLTLSTANDFTGPVTVNNGTLRIGNNSALGSLYQTITINPGGQVDINGISGMGPRIYTYVISGFGQDGLGALRNNSTTGPGAVGLQNLTLNADAAIFAAGRFDINDAGGVRAGLINGQGFKLTKNGIAPMPFHGTVTNLPELIINEGLIYSETRDFNLAAKVTINAPGRVGSYGFRTNSAELVFNGGTWENTGNNIAHWLGPVTINAPITVQLLGTSAGTTPQDIRHFGLLNGPGSIFLMGGGGRAFELYANNDATFTGGITVSNHTILRLVNGGTWGTGVVTNNGVVEFNQNFDNAFTGTILGGSNIVKNLANILKLAAGTGDQFGDSSTLNLAGGMFDLNGNTEAVRALIGSAVLSNSATTTATLILTNPSGTPTFSGTLAGNLAVVVKNSSAKNSNLQVFTGSNFFTGGLTIDNGHLRAANDWFLGAVPATFDASNITLKNGGVLQNSDSYLSLHPNRGLRLDNGDGVFYVGWVKDVTVNGVISGPGNLVKTDGGRLILNAANTYTGNTTISQGRLLLSALGSINTSPVITIASGAFFDASLRPAYPIPAGQTINGAGTVAGSLAVAPGGTLAPGTSLGTLTVGNDLILSGGRILFEMGSVTNEGGTANDLLNVGGDLVVSGPTMLKIEPWTGALDTTGGYYTLINYSGALLGNPAEIQVVTDSRYTLALDTSVPGKIRCSVTSGTPADALWLGDWSGGLPQADWDVKITPNWDTGMGSPDYFSSGDRVMFDGTASSFTVNLVGSLYAASMTFVQDADYTITGPGSLAGGSLIKAGSSMLTLANSGLNTYTGPTVIDSGGLQVGNGGTSGNLSAASIVTNKATLIFKRSDAITVPNVIDGIGGLRQEGSGILTLSGASVFTGPVTVAAGTLRPGNNAAFGGGGNSITVNGGGAVDFNGTTMANRNYSYTLAGSGPDGRGALLSSGASPLGNSGISNVTLSADAAVGAFGAGADGGRFDFGTGTTVAGQYGLFDAGDFTLTKAGPGVVTIRIPSVNFPSAVVTGGTLKGENFDFNLATNILVYSNASIATYGTRTNSSAITLFGGATNYNDGGNSDAWWLGPITNLGPATFSVLGINGNGNIHVAGNLYGSSWYNILGANSRFVDLVANNDATFSGNWMIQSANTLRLSGSGTPGSGIVTNAGTIEVFNTNATELLARVVGTGNFNHQLGAAPLTISGPLQAGIIRARSGNLANPVVFAAGANIRTPAIAVGDANGGGSLLIQPGASVAAGNFFLGEQNTQTGRVVQAGGDIIVSNHVRVGHWPNNISPYVMGGGTLTIIGVPGAQVNQSGVAEQNGVIYLGIDGIGVFTQTGGVVRTPSMVLDSRGSTPALGGVVDTYAMEGGTLILGPYGIKSGSTDANTTYQIYLGGGTVSASANWISSRAMNLTGTNGDVKFDPAGYSISLSGTLSGNGGLIQNGAGTLTLSGANTYFGATLVNDGTLLYSGSLAAGAGQITVAGGTLAGTGAINAPVVVQPGGTLAPGASLGTLTIGGPLTLGGNTVMEVNKTGTAFATDRIVGVSTLTYGGTLTLVVTGDPLNAGDTFDLFDAAEFVGSFAELSLPPLAPGLSWDFSKLALDGTISLRTLKQFDINVNSSLSLSVTKLTAGTFCAGSTLTGVSASTNGVAVNYDPVSQTVTYTPPACFAGTDAFWFTNQNCVGMAVVKVGPAESTGTSLALSYRIVGSNLIATIKAQGIAGYEYQLQRAEELVGGSWSNLSVRIGNPTPGNGTNFGGMIFTDTNPPSPAFYRTKHQTSPCP